jgi:[acyl-carrier-protein] S-malonyltransferase
MSVAYIFPGQGSQRAGMGREVFERSAAAREVFERADRALGEPLSRLCFEGPEEALRLTANTQPAILTVSVAVWAAAREAGAPDPDFAAGHSLGEYSALVAAGGLALADAVRLVRSRGTFMQEAVPVGEGAMAAVLGLDADAVLAACEEAAEGDVCAPANFNSPGQIVIAGAAAAVARASEAARRAGARRVIPLEVSAPFHTALMEPAAERLRPLLEATEFRDPRVPVMANATATLVETGEAARRALVAQVASPVLWEQSVAALAAAGVGRYVELGPGRVLAGLVRKIVRGAEVLSAETPEEIAAVAAGPSTGAGPAQT